MIVNASADSMVVAAVLKSLIYYRHELTQRRFLSSFAVLPMSTLT